MKACFATTILTMVLVGASGVLIRAESAQPVERETLEAGFQAEVHDVVVYGGTPGGITAAISAAREGLSVVLLEQTRHVGGLSTSGLNRDELEHMDQRTMGGLSERFLNEAARLSRVPPKPEGFVIRGPRVWQSHIAEKVFQEMLAKADVPVRYEQLLL